MPLYIDIDECSTGVHNCTQNQQCIDKPGTFRCECIRGYRLLNGICEGNIKHCQNIFKPGMLRPQTGAPGFLELLLSANVCMCMCVSAPKAINN